MTLTEIQREFQFTDPGKGATRSAPYQILLSVRFQFTHPGKGATNTNLRLLLISNVSIHAPWEGCDLLLISSTTVVQGFNSRTLGRVRRHRFLSTTQIYAFQFTHPGKGATYFVRSLFNRLVVSIHAPWEGCDAHRPTSRAYWRRFNSRTLGRVRLTRTTASWSR